MLIAIKLVGKATAMPYKFDKKAINTVVVRTFLTVIALRRFPPAIKNGTKSHSLNTIFFEQHVRTRTTSHSKFHFVQISITRNISQHNSRLMCRSGHTYHYGCSPFAAVRRLMTARALRSENLLNYFKTFILLGDVVRSTVVVGFLTSNVLLTTLCM